MYILAIMLSKLAVLFFYIRVFPQREFQRLVYLVMAFAVCYIIAFEIVVVFQCKPISQFWLHWQGTGAKCLNINAVGWSAAAVNITVDIVILILPIPYIWKLQTTQRRKIQISSMFGVGIL